MWLVSLPWFPDAGVWVATSERYVANFNHEANVAQVRDVADGDLYGQKVTAVKKAAFFFCFDFALEWTVPAY